MVLGATVRLVEDAPHRALAVLGYPSMFEAADAVPALLATRWCACEGLDSRIVDVVRGQRRRRCRTCRGAPAGCSPRSPVPTPAEARGAAAAVAADAGAVDAPGGHRRRGDGRAVADPRGRRRARRAARLDRPAQSGWEDAAVPPERLGDYLRDFDALLRDAGLDGVPYGHFGDGCVHVRIDFPLDASAGGARGFRQFVEAAADLTAAHGGSLSGEHGDGRARSELLPRMYSAGGDRPVRAASSTCSTPTTCSTPACSSTRAPVDADLRLAARLREPRRTRCGWPTTAAPSSTRCTAAPGSASASRTTPAPAA